MCTPHAPGLQDFSNEEQGDALFAMSMALALEKLNFQKISGLSEVAEKHGDAQMSDFLDEMLQVRTRGCLSSRVAHDACMRSRAHRQCKACTTFQLHTEWRCGA